METMTKEEAMKYCRYYGKVDMEKRPTNYEEGAERAFARIERSWIFNLQNYPEIISEDLDMYKRAGLENFNEDDGVPLSLKACIFGKVISKLEWGDEVETFKDVYCRCYLGHRRIN